MKKKPPEEIIPVIIKMLEKATDDEYTIMIDTGLQELGELLSGETYYKRYWNIFIEDNKLITKKYKKI